MSINLLSADFSIINRLYLRLDQENGISTKKEKLRELNSSTRGMGYIFFIYSFLFTFFFLVILFKSAFDAFHSSANWIHISLYAVASILLVSFSFFINKHIIEKRKKVKQTFSLFS